MIQWREESGQNREHSSVDFIFSLWVWGVNAWSFVC